LAGPNAHRVLPIGPKFRISLAGLLTDLADRRVLGSFTLLKMALGKDPLVGPGEVQDETATLRENDGPGRLVEDLCAVGASIVRSGIRRPAARSPPGPEGSVLLRLAQIAR
jgi:hypothetical protein